MCDGLVVFGILCRIKTLPLILMYSVIHLDFRYSVITVQKGRGFQAIRAYAIRDYVIRDYVIRDYAIRDNAIRDYVIRDYTIRDYAIRDYAIRD